MAEPTRRLLVLRHAAAGQAEPGGSDAERPLTPAGRRAAAALQDAIVAAAPELVLVSSALRTRQTLDALALPAAVDVSVEPGLYGAEADELIDHLRAVDDQIEVVLLVGHNPAVHQLVVELTGGERVPSFRPATLAVLELDIARWHETDANCARLLHLHVPDRGAR